MDFDVFFVVFIVMFVLAFLIGIFLAHITLKHNSVIPAIIVHIFINTMSGVVSNVEEYFGFGGIIVAECVILVIAIAGFFMLCLFRGKDKVPSSTPAQSRRGIAVAKKSVVFVSAVLLQLIYKEESYHTPMQ